MKPQYWNGYRWCDLVTTQQIQVFTDHPVSLEENESAEQPTASEADADVLQPELRHDVDQGVADSGTLDVEVVAGDGSEHRVSVPEISIDVPPSHAVSETGVREWHAFVGSKKRCLECGLKRERHVAE